MAKSELQIEREIRIYLDLLRYSKKCAYRFIRVPIPGVSTWKQNLNAQKMAGHADLEIYLPAMVTIHVELKTEVGRQSPQQIEWQQELEAVGHKYYVVRSLERMQSILEEDFGLPRIAWRNGVLTEIMRRSGV